MPDFQAIRRLGAGQFGEVWLVLDRALGVERAVKTVRPSHIQSQTNFYAEPQTLVQLKHHHIVEVHDAGRLADGSLYIAMEYLPNGSVEDRHRGGVVPVTTALTIVSEACRGVEFAHSQGYVHRDLKPANLLVGDHGTKVSDFGLASRVDAQGIASPIGYVAHLAPEVLDQDETSVRSDVYALAVTLYRLVNGDSFLPGSGELPNGLEDAIRDGRYPNRQRFREHVHGPLRRVIRKAMATDPRRRTATAAQLRHDIERVMPYVSWREIATTSVRQWLGESIRHTYTAEVTRVGSHHCFDVRKRLNGGQNQRRLVADCGSFPSEPEALRHAARVLQRLAGTDP